MVQVRFTDGEVITIKEVDLDYFKWITDEKTDFIKAGNYIFNTKRVKLIVEVEE